MTNEEQERIVELRLKGLGYKAIGCQVVALTNFWR